MSIQVVVVEDEPKVQRFIQQAIRQAGMQVECLDGLDDLPDYLNRTQAEVLVLDRLIGKRDALTQVGQLRRQHPQLKILVLSALGEADQRVLGLELGADDYLAKPFHVAELIARIRSLSRRENISETDQKLVFADLQLHLQTQEAQRGQQRLNLTSKEFKILVLLMRFPQKIFSRSELLDRIWGVNADPGSNVVEVTINRLRQKINLQNLPALIHTRRGSGYWIGDAHSD